MVRASIRFLVLLVLLSVGGAWAAAGDSPAEVQALRDAYRAGIDRMLEADDVRLQAWGARLAGGFEAGGDAALVNALLVQARRHGRGTTAEARHAAKAALDALIRLEAIVPPSEIYPLFQRHRSEVILLLAPGGRDAVPHLLDALQVPTADAVWMAAVGLLARERAPGMAAHLLRDLEVTITASVLPDRNAMIGIGGGDGATPRLLAGIQPGGVLAGWPTLAVWGITDRPAPGSRVVVGGEHPVHAIRMLVREAEYSDAETTSMSRNSFRFVALAALLGVPSEHTGLKQEVRMTVYWDGDDDYVERVQKRWQIAKLRHGFAVDRLKHAGLLTEEEASTIHPRISVRAEWLGSGTHALPAVPEPE